MTNFVHVKANAKLNLHLEVLGKRQDGYHALNSVFQTVSLCDELTVSLIAGEGECQVYCSAMNLPKVNTLTKAYEGFCSVSGVKQNVSVTLDKKIPSGAGLGGGSSDAASFLRALNELFAYPLNEDDLFKVALSVGSDVPFFLVGECAVVTGRGERVYPIPVRKDLSFILVYPEIHSSTAKAYELVDVFASEKKVFFGNEKFDGVEKTDVQVITELNKVYNTKVSEWTFFNSFTEPLVENYPKIKDVLTTFKALGADFTEMSGSGSTVFGVFSDTASAKNAYRQLCVDWQYCYCLLPFDS